MNEKDLRQAFEKVTTRNVTAAVAHGNETRKMFRELEKKVDNLQNTIITRDEEIKNLELRVAKLQQEVSNMRTTGK